VGSQIPSRILQGRFARNRYYADVAGEGKGFYLVDIDAQFFQKHRDRRARIRLPGVELGKDRQRAVRYLSESELQFRSLGPHDPKRRRIIVYRTPADHPTHPDHLMKIPFLLNSDETVEDRDDVLLPIVDQIMKDAAK
jgi:hypothetical protein